MNTWDELAAFEPAVLKSAAAQIEMAHARVGPDDALDPDLVEQLRAILARSSVGQLEHVAGTLVRRQLLAIADLVAEESDEEILHKGIALAGIAPTPGLAARAWKLALDVTGVGLQQLLHSLGNTPIFTEITGGDGKDRVRRWVAHESLPVGLLEDLEAAEVPAGNWIRTLPELSTPLIESSAAYGELLRAILTQGAPATLQIEEPRLTDWATELSLEGRSLLIDDFAVHYVTALRDGRQWNEVTADWIVSRFDTPNPASLTGIWNRAEEREPGAPAEFASWLALKKLEEFFTDLDDPYNRFRFWSENFGTQLTGAEIRAGGDVVLLRFSRIVVAEFAMVGNAAYVYPSQQWDWLSGIRSDAVDDYKDRSRLVRADGGGYRIIHSRDWQTSARLYINEFLRRRRL